MPSASHSGRDTDPFAIKWVGERVIADEARVCKKLVAPPCAEPISS